MKIKFNKVTLHHFLSFGDGFVDLNDRGYTLVSGVNKNPKDNALSNGSGKSTIWSAICFALTGETIQGLTKNLPNIYFGDGCWVELDFNIGKTNYVITRYRDDKKMGTDLKIIIDGEDKSGKGIRESQNLLESYIPDLTSSLIGSVIILGQGLPHKFSNNTPVGRKEVLEKLSKSDFMVQDIKNRLSSREVILKKTEREYDDKLLTLNTQIGMYREELSTTESKLKDYEIEKDFDIEIEKCNVEIKDIEEKILLLNKNIDDNNDLRDVSTTELGNINNKKSIEVNEENDAFNEFKDIANKRKLEVQTNIRTLENEIKTLKSITDICPTCKQKLPNVSKPNTTEKELSLSNLKDKLSSIDKNITANTTEHNEYLNEINSKYNSTVTKLNESLTKCNSLNRQYNSDIQTKTEFKSTITNNLNKLILEKNNFVKTRNELIEKVDKLKNTIKVTEDDISKVNVSKNNNNEHIDVISKMNTLIKRDFRGVLLGNVIDFINVKSKEYCQEVFGTTDISFTLDGNNINISYCDKLYENLSGGEKQKVDLIVQFSIRDMLCQYLDFSSNILVLDEIFDNLDSYGCDKVINLISNKLNDVESIFIVSHHSDELQISYDDTVLVQKDSNGVSKIV